MKWGWIINDLIFIFDWTFPLRITHVTFHDSFQNKSVKLLSPKLPVYEVSRDY